MDLGRVGVCLSIFLMGLITCLNIKAASAASEKLEYAYPDVSVWTTKRTPFGELKNPLLRLADELFFKAEIPWESKDYPANRMFHKLVNGNSKFSMLVKAPQLLNGCCLVSEKRVAVVELRSFSFKNHPLIIKREEFKGKKVIIIRGYSYAGLTKYIKNEKNNISYITVPNHQKAFQLLNDRKADYVIDYARPADEVLSGMYLSDLTFSTLKQSDVHLILHKSYANAEKVMKKLEAIVDTIDRSWYLSQPTLQYSNVAKYSGQIRN